MKYKLIILFLLTISCTQNFTKSELKKPFNSKGFAYIYNEKDFLNKTIKKKLDKDSFQIAHDRLRQGTLIKITNVKTNDSIILKNTKRFEYPEFYKILITQAVADKINLQPDLPLVEIIEVKKNKSFVAKKAKIFKEEEKIHNKAPVDIVKIDNISLIKKNQSKITNEKFYIIIAEFYSKESANILKKRISQELTSFDRKKLYIKSKKSNKITLLSGPYNSINLMKNDYIQLKKFGFEELDISINE
jgi:rare lipoprotein A (peptidoglycan hydrolase)